MDYLETLANFLKENNFSWHEIRGKPLKIDQQINGVGWQSFDGKWKPSKQVWAEERRWGLG